MPRPKTFSVESALDKAIEVFRQRGGYHNTPMRMIADRLGLSRSSIYATFGDKHGLFEQTLRRYGPTCRVPGLNELHGPAPRAALLQVFERAIDGSDGGHDQCLLINSAIGLKDISPEVAAVLQTALCDLETRFREAIERATATDEIIAGVDPVHTARALLGLYLGLCVLVRSGGARDPVLRAVVHQVQTMLPQEMR